MGVSDQLHASALLPPGVDPLIRIGQEAWVGRRAGLDAVEKRQISCSYRELNHGHPARSLVTIQIELTRLTYPNTSITYMYVCSIERVEKWCFFSLEMLMFGSEMWRYIVWCVVIKFLMENARPIFRVEESSRNDGNNLLFRIIILQWKWRQKFRPKHWYAFTELDARMERSS
jgi:hypothetical protein